MHFLRFRLQIQFICERSAEKETMQFSCGYGFGSVLVRCLLKQPLYCKQYGTKFDLQWEQSDQGFKCLLPS